MFEWIISSAATAAVKAFGDTFVQPVLTAFLKSKDVDLEKFKSANTTLEHQVVAVLEANTRFAQTKATYALAVLNWRPFRILFFIMMAVAISHYSLVVIDTALPYVFGYDAWVIQPVKGDYAEVTKEILLFFIIAKPVDTAVSGAMQALITWLEKRK